MKKYSAPCTLSINLTFKDGRQEHINFEPNTGLGSYYVTDDLDTIWALENHSLFGKEFFLVRVTEDKKPEEKQEDLKDDKHEVVEVDTMSEAKEILNERFGIPRSSMKTLPQVLSTGYEHKIIFKGLIDDKKKGENKDNNVKP